MANLNLGDVSKYLVGQPWKPEGISDATNEDMQPVIGLSESTKHLTTSPDQAAKMLKRKRERIRCPICGVPYENQQYMRKCASMPIDTAIVDFLGKDTGDLVSFTIAVPDGKRLHTWGKVRDFSYMRVPDRHLQVPAVDWNSLSRPEVVFTSLLVPDGQHDNELTAFPHFTQRKR